VTQKINVGSEESSRDESAGTGSGAGSADSAGFGDGTGLADRAGFPDTEQNINPLQYINTPADDEKKSVPPRDNTWIAEVSHELRLPLANIKLLVETLLDGAVEDKETAIRMLERAQREVNRLEALVKDLLSVEEVAEQRDELKAKAVPLMNAATYAIECTSKQAEQKNIVVIAEVQPGFIINANPDQLNQVVLNLVENAIKYTSDGGRVWIRSGNPGVFSVSDNGIGIASAEIPKIFKRFYRVDRSQAPGSTGLGLSIVKHIADLHGAKITVQSQESKGSTFFLEFPDNST
jgi:Signal transduction histidine kinase